MGRVITMQRSRSGQFVPRWGAKSSRRRAAPRRRNPEESAPASSPARGYSHASPLFVALGVGVLAWFLLKPSNPGPGFTTFETDGGYYGDDVIVLDPIVNWVAQLPTLFAWE